MNDIEIYGMKVNDIKDVREILTVLWTIQQKQEELVRLQGEVAGELKKKIGDISLLLSQLDTTMEQIESINQNLDRFVEAVKTVNENIGYVYDTTREVKTAINKLSDELKAKISYSIEKTVSDRIGSEVSKLSSAISKKLDEEIPKLSGKAEEIESIASQLSKTLNKKVFFASATLGMAIGLLLSLNWHEIFTLVQSLISQLR